MKTLMFPKQVHAKVNSFNNLNCKIALNTHRPHLASVEGTAMLGFYYGAFISP